MNTAYAARLPTNGWTLKIILALFGVLVSVLSVWGANLRDDLRHVEFVNTSQDVAIGKLETKLDELKQGQNELKSDVKEALKLLLTKGKP